MTVENYVEKFGWQTERGVFHGKELERLEKKEVRKMKINRNLEQIVINGEYVATPVKNAFNRKTSYWLSKRGCIISIYMFTAETCCNWQDLEQRLTEQGIRPFIQMLEERLQAGKEV